MQVFKDHSDLISINSMLFELACLRRWSEVTVGTGNKYNELGKQALNAAICYVLSTEMIHEGVEIDLTLFPKIAIYRGFVKGIQCDIPEHNLNHIFELGQVSKSSFDEMIRTQLEKNFSKELIQFLSFDSNSIELRVHKAATKLATLLELEEIKSTIPKKEYNKKHHQLEKDLEVFYDLPGFKNIMSDEYKEIFADYSQLRNRIRWAKHPNIVKCTVLGHHFDVAVLAYLMALEVNPEDQAQAAQYFFMGIFHDFPEKWTGDMPSPIKDALPGLRAATEIFENEVMAENVYSKLPDYQVSAIKKIMLEEEENSELKVFLKKSDNFSATIECWRELDGGSKHAYYSDVIKADYSAKESLPENFRLLMEKLYEVMFR